MQFVSLCALAAAAGVTARPDMGSLLVALTMFGFGQGLVMAPLSGVVLQTVGPSHAGSGAGLLNTVHQTAGAVGVAIVGVLWASAGGVGSEAILPPLGFLAVTVLTTAALLGDRPGDARVSARTRRPI